MKFEDFLSKSYVILDPEVKTKKELFEILASFLYEKGIIKNEEKFFNDLLENEKKGTTGIGEGIAFPHLMMDELGRSYIIITRLKKPIDYNSIDGKPVNLVILFLSHKDNREEYLRNLSQIARRLQKEQTIKEIIEAKTPESIILILTSKYKENFWTKNSRVFYFLITTFVTFILFKIIFPSLDIPENEITKASNYLKFNEILWINKQILSASVFLATVTGTLLFWHHRVAIASLGLGVLLLSGVMDIHTAIEFMSIPTILFIISMMVIISYFESVGLFDYLILNIIKRIGPYPRRIFFILMLFSGILGGFVGEITAILVLVLIAISLCDKLDLEVFPFIIGLVFTTNNASALTMIGNPIGIYIAFAGHLTFLDFLRWATPISFGCTILISFILIFIFRNYLPKVLKIDLKKIIISQNVNNIKKIKVAEILFLILIFLIGLSKKIDQILKLETNTTLVAIPLLFVGLIVFAEKKNGKNLITKGVDWWSIIFFMFLFAKAACLEYTGVTIKLSYSILNLAKKISIPFISPEYTLTIILLIIITIFTGITSGFVDNLPIIAALVPVIKNLKFIGLAHSNILWWGLLFGGCFGGNLTMIGSSANMVALSLYEKYEGKVVHFSNWLKYGLPIFFISIIIALISLIIQIPFSL